MQKNFNACCKSIEIVLQSRRIKYITLRCQNNLIRLVLVKRETGANPVRTRHRN